MRSLFTNVEIIGHRYRKPIFTTCYNDPPVVPPVVPPIIEIEDIPLEFKGKTTFTQEEVNKILGVDRGKHKAKIQEQITKLEQMSRAKDLTSKAQEDLQKRITELQEGLLTKEQLAQKEKERLENSHKEIVTGLSKERELWQNRFTKSSIEVSITSEAVKAEAFDPDSLIALLGPQTRLVQDADPTSGQLLETFTPKVKFNDTDKEGKPIQLDLTIPEATKRMREIPKYGYLFKSTAAAGLGRGPNVGNGETPDVSKMTPEQYREHRKKQGLGRNNGKPPGAS